MKKVISLFLCAAMLLTGCTAQHSETSDVTSTMQSEVTTESHIETELSSETTAESATYDLSEVDIDYSQFTDLSDPDLLSYVEDTVYAELAVNLRSDDYMIENVAASYISQEYLDEVAYNSQSNIYFGYTLSELNDLFQGTKYVFTLGEDGQTTVQELVEIEDTTNEEILKNVAIGTGVILVCVTVSYFTAGAATPTAVNLFFTAAAKGATSFAVSSAALGGISAGVVRGIETGDINEALKATAFESSEGFKWGGIVGAVAGGGSEAFRIIKSSKTIPSPRQSELKVLDMTDDAVEQVSYLAGKEVASTTTGATRPDVVVKNLDGTVKAIEVKNYNLNSSNSRNHLYSELERQVTSRVNNLPAGSTQEIVLDVRGRGYSTNLIESVVASIKERLNSVYYNIPVEVLRY